MKKPESLAAMGAQVKLGGHEGCFIADILDPGGDLVVVRTEPADSGRQRSALYGNEHHGAAHPSRLHRYPMQFSEPTHHLLDFPERPVMWDDKRGVFIVPRAQLKRYINGELEK